MEFSIRSMKLIIKNQTTKRVSEGSAEALGEEAQKFAEEIAEDAKEIAEEDGRITVRQGDIKKAVSNKKTLVTTVETKR